MRFGIIASRFNAFITERLLDGAVSGLRRHGADTDANVDVVWVPGAFEISFCAHKMAKSGKYDALICVGAVIRGETPHFDYICGEASRGVGNAMNQYGIPHRLRPADHQHGGAGGRSRRGEDGKQGIRGCRHRHRNGASLSKELS